MPSWYSPSGSKVSGAIKKVFARSFNALSCLLLQISRLSARLQKKGIHTARIQEILFLIHSMRTPPAWQKHEGFLTRRWRICVGSTGSVGLHESSPVFGLAGSAGRKGLSLG